MPPLASSSSKALLARLLSGRTRALNLRYGSGFSNRSPPMSLGKLEPLSQARFIRSIVACVGSPYIGSRKVGPWVGSWHHMSQTRWFAGVGGGEEGDRISNTYEEVPVMGIEDYSLLQSDTRYRVNSMSRHHPTFSLEVVLPSMSTCQLRSSLDVRQHGLTSFSFFVHRRSFRAPLSPKKEILQFPSLILSCKNPSHLNQIQAHLTTSGLLLPSLFLHNLLIRSHSHHQTPTTPLLLYSQLLRHGHFPNSHTIPPLLKSSPPPHYSLSLHSHSLKLGLLSHLFVINSLLHFYSTHNLSASIQLFAQSSHCDSVTYNSMISAYLKHNDFGSAKKLFDEMSERNVVSWSAMISGCVNSGRSKEALKLFVEMQEQGVEPEDRTLVSVLAACAHLGALEQGKWVHGYLRSKSKRVSVYLGSCLIDMYAKCGEVDLGLKVFREMPERNLLVWTTVIKGLAMHGRGVEALELFSEMENNGIRPDDIAFIGALCACTHAGLVNKGRQLFTSMSRNYKMKPKIEHYGCMVDLLSRNGLLDEAKSLVDSMPIEPDALIYGALMAGCRFYKNVELAEYVVNHLIRLEPDCSGVYVLLANIYAASGRHDDARSVRNLMKQKGVEKTPGCSLVEINGIVHQFIVGDTSHPRIKDILAKWEEIERRIKLEGYVPDRREVLLNIDEEEKDDALARHSEKLAITFGLISTEDGVSIRVVKNLRVCGDCHHVTKLISKVYDRQIVVRDRTRFHLFKRGSCSCNDYW